MSAQGQQIASLKTDFYRLWAARGRRISQSIVVLIVGAVALFAPIPWGPTGWILAGLLIVVGAALLVAGIRLRFRAESVSDEIRRLDPAQGLVTSPAEEMGRALRDSLTRRSERKP